jgi:hypothetical protein
VLPFAQPRTTVTPLQLPPLWLIALVLVTLALVAGWAVGQECTINKPGIETVLPEGDRRVSTTGVVPSSAAPRHGDNGLRAARFLNAPLSR